MSTRKIHDEFEAPQHTERVGSTGSSDGPRPYVTELIHLHDIEPRGPAMLRWEQKRHSHARWFVECLAEAVGVASLDLDVAVLMRMGADGDIHLLVRGRRSSRGVHPRHPRGRSHRL
jgi:hypothetical protein